MKINIPAEVIAERQPNGDVAIVANVPTLGVAHSLVAVIDADQVPEDWTLDQVVDAYFNSPYGVA